MDVLVVEDERNLSDAICHILGEAGYNAAQAFDGPSGLEAALGTHHDVIMLDVMLPGMSGFDVVSQLREASVETPVIMVTAKATTADKIEGLDHGADDYMTKPIDTDELLARIRALTRRHGEADLETRTFGDLTLDLVTHDLVCGDRQVHLSQKEYEVLKLLMEAKGVVSKTDLLKSAWHDGEDVTENSAEAYISFLRKKLAHINSLSQITTYRMLGYRLEEPDGRDTRY